MREPALIVDTVTDVFLVLHWRNSYNRKRRVMRDTSLISAEEKQNGRDRRKLINKCLARIDRAKLRRTVSLCRTQITRGTSVHIVDTLPDSQPDVRVSVTQRKMAIRTDDGQNRTRLVSSRLDSNHFLIQRLPGSTA